MWACQQGRGGRPVADRPMTVKIPSRRLMAKRGLQRGPSRAIWIHIGKDHDMATKIVDPINSPINGTEFNDKLFGTGKSDRLIGYDGDDTLRAGDGQDQLIAGGGSDVLTGDSTGHYADMFIFGKHSGRDVVTDFDVKRDVVMLQARPNLHHAEDVLAHAVQHGANVIIDLGHGDKIILKNVNLDDLKQDPGLHF
eukprot:gene9884-13322_t